MKRVLSLVALALLSTLLLSVPASARGQTAEVSQTNMTQYLAAVPNVDHYPATFLLASGKLCGAETLQAATAILTTVNSSVEQTTGRVIHLKQGGAQHADKHGHAPIAFPLLC